MEYLLGLIGVLLGGFVFNFIKRKSAESLLVNTETKEKLVNIDADINKDKASLELERLKREELTNNLNKEKESNESLENLKDFFNKPSDK
jgi:hypothetical protein